jgi:hypothetical protein
VDDPDVIFPDSEARPMWHDPDNSSDGTTGAINAFFRRTFELDYSSGATFTGQARIWTDDDFAFYVNGTQVAADENNDRGPLVAVDISNHLMDGENVFAIRAVDGRLADPFDRVYEVLLFEARIEPVDGTPPVCGEIETVTDARDRLTQIRTTATDDESGIARADFLRLNNLRGFVNGQGPFSEDEVVHFDPTTTSMVSIRGERISFTTGGAIVVRVTNGAGLTSDCDPVAMSLVAEAPESFGLEASYPNPFRSVTTIPFRLAEPGHVTLTVYDALGREVARLVDREMAAGAYEVQWTAPRLASGTYFYRVEAGDFRATRRMSIVR